MIFVLLVVFGIGVVELLSICWLLGFGWGILGVGWGFIFVFVILENLIWGKVLVFC